MNPLALGWDNHRKFSKVSLMEQTSDGQIRAVERATLEHDDKDAMRAWLSRLDPEIPVALEATFGWPWVADLLEELGHPVHLGYPPIIRAWPSTRQKPTVATAIGWGSSNSAAYCRKAIWPRRRFARGGNGFAIAWPFRRCERP